MDKILRVSNKETIFYREYGHGEPVVLVPSLWVTSKSYRALGQELGKFYRVFIPDIFCGRSKFSREATGIDAYASKLAVFIRRLRLKTYYLIGVSISGMIVTNYIRRNILLPKKIFLVSTTVLPLNIRHQRFTLWCGYCMLLYHNLFSLDGIATNWLWITDGLENAWRHFRQAWTEGIIATSLKIEDVNCLPVPTKLLFALRDEFIPREAVSRLLKVRNLEVETVDCHHGWFFRHEEELVQKIAQFFQ